MNLVSRIIFLLSLILFTSISIADTFNGLTNLQDKSYEDLTINGPANLGHIKAKKLNVNGPLQFSHLSVEEDGEIHGPVNNSEKGYFANLKIVGPFNAIDIVCDNLFGEGVFDVTDLIVKNQMQVTGPIKLKHAEIKTLEANSHEIILMESKVQDILVNDDNKKKEQKLTLDKTVVSGNVIFKSGKGIIEMDSDSVIHGTITGAVKK